MFHSIRTDGFMKGVCTCDNCCEDIDGDSYHTEQAGIVCERCFEDNYEIFEGEIYLRNDCTRVRGGDYNGYYVPDNLLAENDYYEPEDSSFMYHINLLTSFGAYWYLTSNCVGLVEEYEGESYAPECVCTELKDEDTFGDYQAGWYVDDRYRELINERNDNYVLTPDGWCTMFHSVLIETLPLLENASIEPTTLLVTYTDIDKDKKITIKLGRLLTKKTSLLEKEIKALVELQRRTFSGTLLMKLTQDADEIVEVYKTAVSAKDSNNSSCMTDESCVRVYAYDSELYLATFYDGEEASEETYVGRTLVRTDTMKFIRTYAAAKRYHDNILKTLEDAGYEKGTLAGIRLAKIETEGGYVMPYLDYNGMCVEERGRSFEVVDYKTSLKADRTDGFMKGVCTCDNCCEDIDGDSYHTEQAGIVCERCFEDNYEIFEGEIYLRNDCTRVRGGDYNGYYVPDNLLAENDYYEPEDSSFMYHINLLTSFGAYWYLTSNCVGLVEEYEGESYAPECVCTELKDEDTFGDYQAGWYVDDRYRELINERNDNYVLTPDGWCTMFHSVLIETLPLLENASIEPTTLLVTYTDIDKDKKITIKLGRLLTKKTSLLEKEIKALVELQRRTFSGTLLMKLTQDADEIVEVYKTAVSAKDSNNSSCMTDESCVRVYAYDSELYLATFYDGEEASEETYVGRTLVRTDTMKFIRTYAAAKRYHDNILKTLEDAGYEKGTLAGIRLAKIETEGGYVMPYLDYNGMCVEERGRSFEVVDYKTSLKADRTDGFMKGVCTCDNCCEDIDGDSYHTEQAGIVCERCFEDNYEIFEGEIYLRNDCTRVRGGDYNGYYVPDNLLAENDYYEPEDSSFMYHINLLTSFGAYWYLTSNCVGLVEEYEGESYAPECVCTELKDEDTFGDYQAGWYVDDRYRELINERNDNYVLTPDGWCLETASKELVESYQDCSWAHEDVAYYYDKPTNHLEGWYYETRYNQLMKEFETQKNIFEIAD